MEVRMPVFAFRQVSGSVAKACAATGTTMMNSSEATRDICKAIEAGDVDLANRLFVRTLFYAGNGRLKARPTIPDRVFFTALAVCAVIVSGGAFMVFSRTLL